MGYKTASIFSPRFKGRWNLLVCFNVALILLVVFSSSSFALKANEYRPRSHTAGRRHAGRISRTPGDDFRTTCAVANYFDSRTIARVQRSFQTNALNILRFKTDQEELSLLGADPRCVVRERANQMISSDINLQKLLVANVLCLIDHLTAASVPGYSAQLTAIRDRYLVHYEAVSANRSVALPKFYHATNSIQSIVRSMLLEEGEYDGSQRLGAGVYLSTAYETSYSYRHTGAALTDAIESENVYRHESASNRVWPTLEGPIRLNRQNLAYFIAPAPLDARTGTPYIPMEEADVEQVLLSVSRFYSPNRANLYMENGFEIAGDQWKESHMRHVRGSYGQEAPVFRLKSPVQLILPNTQVCRLFGRCEPMRQGFGDFFGQDENIEKSRITVNYEKARTVGDLTVLIANGDFTVCHCKDKMDFVHGLKACLHFFTC